MDFNLLMVKQNYEPSLYCLISTFLMLLCVQADGVPLHEPGDPGGVVSQRRGGVQPAQAPGGGGGGAGGRQQDAAAV